MPMRRQFSVDEFQSTRFQIFQLTSIIREAEDRKRRNWPDDAEVLKAYVSALSSTKTVLEEEQAQLLQKLDLIDVKTERLDPTKRQALASTKSEVQEKLRDFKQRIQDDETRIQQAEYILSNGVKPEEKSMIEDQITILKETQKMCTNEAYVLEGMLKEIGDMEQKQRDQYSEWDSLRHLKQQLTKLESKMDHAKRCLLFPFVQGYKFRVGTNGIYVGAKDWVLSDFAAGFSLSVEAVKQSERTAVVRLQLGGREFRPGVLANVETDSLDGSLETTSLDMNEVNNHLSSETSVDAHVEDSIQEEDIVSISDSDPQFKGKEQSTFDPVGNNRTADIPSASNGPLENVMSNSEQTSERPLIQMRTSPGRTLAMKFLAKLAEKRDLGGPKFQPQTSIRPQNQAQNVSPPGNTLLKKFILASDSVAIRGGTPTIRLTTPLQYTKRRSEDSSWNENDSDALSETMSLPGNAHFDVRRMDKFRGRSFATFGTHQRTSTFGGSSRRSDIWGRRDAVSEAPSDNTSLVGMGRRGVYMKLKGEHVCLFGEKGTRVPNVTVKDITLEVECSLSVCFEFSERYGWQSKEGLKFEIIQLRKEVVGSSIPMPVTLVRTLLNLILPKIVEKALLSALPRELGLYVLEADRGMATAGEITIEGPSLCTTQALLNTTSPYSLPRSRPADLKAFAAVQEAQNLLSLTPEQSMLLGECFSKSTWGLLDPNELWKGECTIRELCRFHDRFSKTKNWTALCDLWTKGLRYVAEEKETETRVDFGALMNGPVARLAAKPMRTQCLFTKLHCDVNVDACLIALKDYCERSARETYAEKPMEAKAPLDLQLQVLQTWYEDTYKRLVDFKSSFKSFLAAIIARADSGSLKIGLEEAQYEGPLNFEVPVRCSSNDSDTMAFDLTMPLPGNDTSTEILDSLYNGLTTIYAFKNAIIQSNRCNPAGQENRVEFGSNFGLKEKVEQCIQTGQTYDSQSCEPFSLGKVFFRHLRTSMTFNEEALTKKIVQCFAYVIETPKYCLGGGLCSATHLKAVLDGLGDLTVGQIVQDDAKDQPVLSFRTSSMARLKCFLDSLGFQSSISPAEICSIVYICWREYLKSLCQSEISSFRWVDRLFEQVMQYLDKRALNVILCSKLTSNIDEGRLWVSLSELNSFQNGIRFPIQITSDIDLASLMNSLMLAQGKLEA